LKKTATDSNVILKYGNDQRDWLLGVHGDDSDKFKLETHDKTDVIVIDSSGKVGIGTASPSAELNIETTGGSSVHISRDRSAGAFDATGWNLGWLAFGGQDSDSGEDNDSAYIQGRIPTTAEGGGAWTSSSHPTEMSFHTTPSGATSTTQRMLISASGNVGIGGASEGHSFQVTSSDANVMRLKRGSGYYDVQLTTNGDLIFQHDGAADDVTFYRDGNVGIGETAPSTQLVLKDGQSDAVSDLDTGGIGLRWNGADGTFYGLVAMDSGSRTYNAGFMGFKGHASGSAGERSIVFATRNGTGDDAPVERLMIHSGGEVTVHADNGGNGSLRITATSSNDTRLILQNQGTLKWNIRSKGNESHRIEIRDADENDGVIMAQGATAFSSGSDERLKCNWTSFNNALSDINSLTKVGTFQYKNFGEDKPRNDKVHAGLSAQEVQKFLPSAIDADEEGEKFLYLRYQELIPVLVKAVQELSAKVEALENA